MRLVLDTNVVLSGLLWTGSPMRILAAAQAGEAELFTSRALLAELHRCLARAKFDRQVAVSGIGREELFLGYVELAEDALRQYVRSHRETVHVTRSRANLRRLRAAHAEIEAGIARRRRNAA